ncbi:hypothetical protein OL599_23165 [Rhodovastum sp. RN2-1]|uniref:Uncharacterized protein n=1 Tax=Limobrevibacterium gyesilva TaxID=2991712 RepID=A0AA41YS03_9PROT|nr:hypothetical protein [Limobrevibacterium gyesilva]
MPIYPSFYPHEMRVETIDPPAAARMLPTAEIHAYVGSPRFIGAVPETVDGVESLGSFVVVTVEPATAADSCAAARAAVRRLAGRRDGFVLHPYPVTPFHADYLQQSDLADAAKTRVLQAAAAPPEVAATVEEIDAAELLASDLISLNGWLGPPWVKSGWWQAWRLLNPALDNDDRERASEIVQNLQAGGYDGQERRLTLERSLVTLLTQGCRRMIAGYTVKKEYFNTEFSAGVENVGFDSLLGLDSPVFLRTVKLKDFPWNGWLRLGIATRSEAAWNPIAGFNDPAGRLIWSALGDPAAFPAPYGDGWILNRFADVNRIGVR